MLRIYKPIEKNPIYKLHSMIEHLVCNVWCKADGTDCLNKLQPEFKKIVDAYTWLEKEIIEIDLICSKLTEPEKKLIKTAFKTNNKIEDLCDGKVEPILLSALPKVVDKKMKPLFKKFYERLLDAAKVSGNKLEFYKSLNNLNHFKVCPCCGYVDFESGRLKKREAYDHYLPKSKYPFTSVNFKNLVPLCYKCNSDFKKAKDPIKNKRKAYYPFRKSETEIVIETKLSKDFIKSLYEVTVNGVKEENQNAKLKDITITLKSKEKELIQTWDDLFSIKDRFADKTIFFSYTLLRRMKQRYNERKKVNNAETIFDTLNYFINEYEIDKYEDKKYLKIPFLKAIKECKNLMQIYS